MKFAMTFSTMASLLPPLVAEEATPGAVFYVAPDGNDLNPGTEPQPFASVSRAQEAVRPRVAAGLSTDVTIFLREGR